ncbi:MAG: D-alanyl-D-alanine carboxypeptidase family protein [Novosphingobium sp.]
MKRVLGIAVLALALPAGATPSHSSGASPSALSPPPVLAEIPVYLAVDLGSHQVLAQHQADRVFLPASMTKVMTAYVAFELIARGQLKPEQVFTASPQTAATWSGRGTGMRLRPGEQVSVDMLLHGITTISANDAAVVLAEGARGSIANWLALMNGEAAKLGMTRSHFATPNGWPDGGATHVSAGDMVKLGQALIARHPALYRRYFGKKTLVWHDVSQANHDPTVGLVPGADGIKTGHTNESGYSFLGTAIRDGRRVMIVVGGAPTEAKRAQAARELLEWGFAAWDARPLFARGAVVGHAAVQGGSVRQVNLVVPSGLSVTVPRGTRPKVTMTLRYRGPLVAPIAANAAAAQLEVSVDGQRVASVPLAVQIGVAAAGPFDRLANGLAGLLP